MDSRKAKIFMQGIMAAHAAYRIEGVYICPLCARRFGRNDLESGNLTLEHVPPASLGGKGIILTCKSCNNKAGHTIDAAAFNKSKLNKFIGGLINRSKSNIGRAKLNIGGTDLVVDVDSRDDKTVFKILGDRNNPEFN